MIRGLANEKAGGISIPADVATQIEKKLTSVNITEECRSKARDILLRMVSGQVFGTLPTAEEQAWVNQIGSGNIPVECIPKESSFITKDVAGFPVWAWILVAGVAVYFIYENS